MNKAPLAAFVDQGALGAFFVTQYGGNGALPKPDPAVHGAPSAPLTRPPSQGVSANGEMT